MQNNIVQFNNKQEQRREKEKEIEFYSRRLETLKKKLFFIEKEIKITEVILELLEKEKHFQK